MTEPAPEPPPPETTHEARDPELETARANVVFGVGLFTLFLLLLIGTIVVAIVYLHFD